MNKNKIIQIVGLVISFIGICLLVFNISFSNSLEVYKDNPEQNDSYKLITNKLEYKDEAIDPELNVKAPSSILIREVEMVQYQNTSEGAKLVLANYQLDSFELDGNKYENPDFNNTLKSMVFYSDTYICDGKLKLDESVVDMIVYDDTFKKTVLTNLYDIENTYGLISNLSSYVSGTDEWKLGDIKVTYSYVDFEDLKEVSIISKVKDNTVNLNDSKATIKVGVLDYDSSKQLLAGNSLPYYLIIVCGLIVIALPIIIKKFKKQ